MKDVLISSMMSMSDDSFASESLTIKCVLSSNEISYSLKSLIDIEAVDYSFIDEVTAQIVCDQLQIESLTLIKCYEHVWINQSSDLILINLIKASHNAMPSLNLAHLFESFSALLLVCSALSSFISFIILLNKHIWSITSHLYQV